MELWETVDTNESDGETQIDKATVTTIALQVAKQVAFKRMLFSNAYFAPPVLAGNIKKLQARWIFQIKSAPRELQGTTVVAGGVMYVTTVNECYALDAGSGRLIWHYQRSRTKNVASAAGTGINPGVAVDGDRVFLQTDNAHLVALNRFTGALLWDANMGDISENYEGTGAPLIVGKINPHTRSAGTIH